MSAVKRAAERTEQRVANALAKLITGNRMVTTKICPPFSGTGPISRWVQICEARCRMFHVPSNVQPGPASHAWSQELKDVSQAAIDIENLLSTNSETLASTFEKASIIMMLPLRSPFHRCFVILRALSPFTIHASRIIDILFAATNSTMLSVTVILTILTNPTNSEPILNNPEPILNQS
ncbi:hypothetical protein BDF20DRAFT_835791 [Mycotypha africana]|uniref:uncharacterized protein n=1 Tax=Mycotypha africana TaxID=64632 RepID=UPI0023002C00|nr:uncharacterized protein BDF20DRAFT_835791 [Mycotypha africana]KAI8979830.1 hypothetical protein BDF20DRAFT_835791 [Mycotypha africana]